MDKHICHTCQNHFHGKYCNNCGEKVYDEKDKSVIHFFDDAIHFITHFDGTLFNTLKAMATKPGLLSLDYCNGIRRKYFKPLSLFLLLVVLYLIFPFFEGLNMRLEFYKRNPLYGHFAEQKITNTLKEKQITFLQLEELFHHKSEKISKVLLVLIIPFTALFFWLFTFKKRKYFFDQLIFSTEINSIYLLWGFLLLPFLTFLFEKFYHFNTGTYLIFSDNFSGLLIYSIVFLYTILASKRFYNINYLKAISLSLLFIPVHTFIILDLYKFILFITTINQI